VGEKNDQNPTVKDDMVEAVNDGLFYQILMNQLFAACHGDSRNHDCSCTGLARPLTALLHTAPKARRLFCSNAGKYDIL
jgi:hypothetical protein